MVRLRLAVKKDGALQFLSHLDFARAVRYVIIRAQIPICYSEGFNPHMKLSFASALGVGVCADVEYMDMELLEKIPVHEVLERMNAKSPDGFAVLNGKYIDVKAPKLMAVANYAVYDLKGPAKTPISQEQLDEILDSFNQTESVQYQKISVKGKHKAKIIDVKKHIIEPVCGKTDSRQITVQTGILETAEGAVKPQQLWNILIEQFSMPAIKDLMLARRRHIFIHKDGINYSLFDTV